jgi:hypothetical protein
MAEMGQKPKAEEQPLRGTQFFLLSGNYLWQKSTGSSWKLGEGSILMNMYVSHCICGGQLCTHSLKPIQSVTQGLALITEWY